jgi:hypothetical protein
MFNIRNLAGWGIQNVIKVFAWIKSYSPKIRNREKLKMYKLRVFTGNHIL